MKSVFGNKRPNVSAILAGLALSLLACSNTIAAPSQTGSKIPTETKQPDLIKLLPPQIAKSKTLNVAAAVGAPPDVFRNDKNEIAGWEIDILHAVTQSMGLDLKLRATTFDSVMPGLQAKRFDAAVGQIGITEVREKVVDMVGTLLGNELMAARKDTNIKVNSLADLCGVPVAMTRGSREYEFAQQQNPKCKSAGKQPIKILVFNDGIAAANSLMSKRSDVFWLGSTAVSYFVRQSDGRAKIVGSYTDKSYIGIALPKNSGMAKAMQAAVQHLIDDGTYAKIVSKWGLDDGAIKKAPLNPKGTAM